MKRFSYSDYERRLLDHTAIAENLRGFSDYFRHCRHVLDLGCASGAFLDILEASGIRCTGIENDPDIVLQLRRRGHSVVAGSATDVWPGLEVEFDGVFCSHLIEHLPADGVIALIEGMAAAIRPGGVAVFAFPNPQSLEMQLFHFWRDPQHVRFYHSDLISGILQHYGFQIDQIYSQGQWGGAWSRAVGDPQPRRLGLRRFDLLRRVGRRVKDMLGISALEIEADYVRKMRAEGRETVIVSHKL